jgi:hypothetical protein
MGTKVTEIVQKRKAQSGTLATVFTVSLQLFFFLRFVILKSLWSACTFYKPLKLVSLVTVLTIVTALRRKSMLFVKRYAKVAVKSSFRANYLLPISCVVDIHFSSPT